MATSATKGSADTIRLPKKMPAIKGLTKAQVTSLYKAERATGLGHVRVMARLANRAKGQSVTPVAELRRFTQPITPKAEATA